MRPRPLHPLHAVLLAGTVPLFLGVLLCDITYASTYEIQWKNFASWLLVGGLVFGGFTLLWALLEVPGLVRDHAPQWPYLLLLVAAFLLGLINAFVHAGDAWASMPLGLILSVIVALLVVIATGIGFSRWRAP